MSGGLSHVDARMKVPDEFGVDDGDLIEVDVANDLRSAKEPEERIMGELARCQYDEQTTFAIKLALEEALTNAVKHGNGNDSSLSLIHI